VQALPPNDANDIDPLANKFKSVKVFFHTSSDLAALSKSHNRDVHIAAYRCDYKADHTIQDRYFLDPVVYDAYGAVTHDRSVTKEDALERFKGIYYFFLPTTSEYGQTTNYIFEMPFDLYLELGTSALKSRAVPAVSSPTRVWLLPQRCRQS